MNSFLNPLMNPALGGLPNPDSELQNPEMHRSVEGRMGNIWSHEDLVDSLNHLIQVCRDGQEGYQQAAENAQSEWLRTQFANYSKQREQFATELTNLVAGFGAEPSTGTTVGGVLHRTWIDLRAAVTGNGGDDKVILDECERGEDTAKGAYEHELEKGLPDHIHSVVQSQYQDVLRAHDQVRDMRDAYPQ